MKLVLFSRTLRCQGVVESSQASARPEGTDRIGASLTLAEVVVDVHTLIQRNTGLGHILNDVDHEVAHERSVVPSILLAPQHVLHNRNRAVFTHAPSVNDEAEAPLQRQCPIRCTRVTCR